MSRENKERKPLVVRDFYENADGRVLRGTPYLAKHAAKFGLVPCEAPKPGKKQPKQKKAAVPTPDPASNEENQQDA